MAGPRKCCKGWHRLINTIIGCRMGRVWNSSECCCTRHQAIPFHFICIVSNPLIVWLAGPIADTVGLTKLGMGPSPAELDQIVSQAVPLRRMGTKDDCANAAIFLASDAASYVTGDILMVDGAQWLFQTPLISREQLQEMDQMRRKKSATPRSRL